MKEKSLHRIKNIQEYRDKKQQINKIFTLIFSKEVDNWFVAILKKMTNWNKFKADGVTPTKKKYLLVLWDLVWGGAEPAPPKQFEEEMDIDGGFHSEVEGDFYKGDDQHQVTSVLI